MSQTIRHQTSRAVIFREASKSVTVAGTTTITAVELEGQQQMGFGITNTAGGGALDAFAINFKYHPDGAYFTVANAAASFTTPVWPVLNITTDIVTLAAGASAGVVLDVRGVYAVQFTGSAAVNPAIITIEGEAR